MKVLVIRLSSFGDQIHVCPAVTDLKRQHPDYEIHWLVQSEFAAVPQAHLCVSKVFPLPLTALRKHPFRVTVWQEFFRTIRNLREERYQVGIDVHGMIKSAVMTVLSGAKTRLGYGYNGLAERFSYWMYHRHFKHTPGMTSVNKLRDFFRWAFNLAPLSSTVDFGLIDQQCGRRFRNCVLFVPFASSSSKTLPLDYWIDLASNFYSEDSTLEVRVSWGTEQEKKMAEALEQRTQGFVLPNPKRFDSTELVEQLKGYKLVVGMDSGITQLANALGIPTVMVFTVSSPKYFFTPGSTHSVYLSFSGFAPASIELSRVSIKLFRELSDK